MVGSTRHSVVSEATLPRELPNSRLGRRRPRPQVHPVEALLAQDQPHDDEQEKGPDRDLRLLAGLRYRGGHRQQVELLRAKIRKVSQVQ